MSARDGPGWESARVALGPFLPAEVNLGLIYIFPLVPLPKYLPQNGPLITNKLYGALKYLFYTQTSLKVIGPWWGKAPWMETVLVGEKRTLWW